MGNAWISAKPKHTILKDCLKNLKPRRFWDKDPWAIIDCKGPELLTDCVYNGLRQDMKAKSNKTLILPPSYFYPLHSSKKEDARNNKGFAENTLCEWSKGIHLWNLSWG